MVTNAKELTPGVSSAKAAVWNLRDRPDVSGYQHHEDGGGGLRVLIIDDHPCIRAHLGSGLGAVSGVHALPGNGGSDAHRPDPTTQGHDVVLLGTCGAFRGEIVELIGAIKSSSGRTRVALLACAMAPETVKEALSSGVDGILSRHLGAEELAMAVRLIHRGQRAVSACFKDTAGEREAPNHGLTSGELEILKLLAAGYQMREVGRAMLMTESTLKRSIRNIRSKLQVRTKAEALVVAVRSGLV